MKLPKKVFIRINKDSNEPFLEPSQSVREWCHEDKVGIYELKEVKTLVIKEELVK